MSKNLTPKQKAVLDFIDSFQKENQRIPFLQEIGKHLGISISSVQQKIYSLTRKKYLVRRNIYEINNTVAGAPCDDRGKQDVKRSDGVFK